MADVKRKKTREFDVNLTDLIGKFLLLSIIYQITKKRRGRVSSINQTF